MYLRFPIEISGKTSNAISSPEFCSSILPMTLTVLPSIFTLMSGTPVIDKNPALSFMV